MAGKRTTLRRGEYRLAVPRGEGPAGVRRSKGDHIAFDIEGGWRTFRVTDREQVWFWWRGQHRHRGVLLERIGRRTRPVDERAERRRAKRDDPPAQRLEARNELRV